MEKRIEDEVERLMLQSSQAKQRGERGEARRLRRIATLARKQLVEMNDERPEEAHG